MTPGDVSIAITLHVRELIRELVRVGIDPAQALGLSGSQLESIQHLDRPLDDDVEARLLKKMGLSRRDVERDTGIMRYATFSVAELSLKELLDILSGKVRNADKSLRTTALGMIQTYLESDSPRPELISALETIIEKPAPKKIDIDLGENSPDWFF